MYSKTFGISVSNRLKAYDIKKAFRNGRSIKGKLFDVVFFETDTSDSAFAAVSKKKFGNAVKRNRFKRLVREFFRLNKNIFNRPLWLVFIAKKKIDNWKYEEILSEGIKLLNKKRLISEI